MMKQLGSGLSFCEDCNPQLISRPTQSGLSPFLLFAFLGNAKQDPDMVADAIIDAIEDFIQKGFVQSVKKVKVVIFVPRLLAVFLASMRKRERSLTSPQESLKSQLICELTFFYEMYAPNIDVTLANLKQMIRKRN